MQTNNNSLKNLSPVLTEMGYSHEMIRLALKEAKSSNLEQILDILESRKDYYESVINKSKAEEPSENIPQEEDDDNDSVDSEDMRLFRAVYNKKPKRKQPLSKIENNLPDKEERKVDDPKPADENKRQKKKNKKNKESKEPKEGKEVKEIMKMDQNSINFLDSSIQSFKYTMIKDPNWHISELVEAMKSLKFKTSSAASSVVSYLKMEGHFPKLEEFKQKIFSMVIKVVTMKVTKKDRIHIENLETALMIAFELNLFKVPQMKSILTLAPKFCARTVDKMSEETYSFLEKHYQAAAAKEGNGFGIDLPVNVWGEVKDAEEEYEGPGLKGGEVGDKEFCIVCMEKVREVVFMPCCHFLTCPLCSPRISKCPVCNKTVQKHLKLFWS